MLDIPCVLLASAIFMYCRHPQDLVFPLFKVPDATSTSLPQSQIHFHKTALCLLRPTISRAVRFPNLKPSIFSAFFHKNLFLLKLNGLSINFFFTCIPTPCVESNNIPQLTKQQKPYNLVSYRAYFILRLLRRSHLHLP